MITIRKILENQKKLVGKDFNADDIICAFEDYAENDGVNEVYVGESDNKEYDYIAYINTKDSAQFLFSVDRIFNKETGCLEREIIKNVTVANVRKVMADLLEKAVDMGFDRDEALEDIDASLDDTFGFEERSEFPSEIISEQLYKDILFGLEVKMWYRENEE